MIIGFSIEPISVIQKLSHSSYMFYLSGSRYFSYPNPDSDWDFFTQNEGDTQWDYLKRLGFSRLPMNPDWYDELCQAIFHHKVGIDIALVSNSIMKKRAQSYILKNGLGFKLKEADMDNRRLIWNEAYMRSIG